MEKMDQKCVAITISIAAIATKGSNTVELL